MKKYIRSDINATDNVVNDASNDPFVRIYIEEGWDLTPKAYRAYLDSGKAIGVIDGEYYIADNQYGMNAEYMGNFFNVKKYFEDLASVSSVTASVTADKNDDIHNLILIRKQAKKAALRDGYDQVIIQSKEDGSYSFSRKYPGCCPDWYGDIIEEVNLITENGKQLVLINEV